MLGSYDNFPENIHLKENYTAHLSTRRLQQRLIRVLQEVNRRTFSFSEIAHPFTPECTTIFEMGLAGAEGCSKKSAQRVKNKTPAINRGDEGRRTKDERDVPNRTRHRQQQRLAHGFRRKR